MTAELPVKIDVHVHFVPPVYAEAWNKHGHGKPDGMPALPAWDVQEHLQLMDELQIAKSILSISSPGTNLVPGDIALAARLSRDCNAYAAELKRQKPNRFGYFATLPMPDVEACISEIGLAIEEGCDGFVLLTNTYGQYLGDEALKPIFQELNNRGSVVFIHPTTPNCLCSKSQHCSSTDVHAAPLVASYPNPMMEFFFDTARALTNMLLSGTVHQCPNIRFIIPHAGGAFPPMISRVTGFSAIARGDWATYTQTEVQELFQRQFWFDLAGFPFPTQLQGLMDGCGVRSSRLLYGSDYPFTSPKTVEVLLGQLADGLSRRFSPEDVARICS